MNSFVKLFKFKWLTSFWDNIFGFLSGFWFVNFTNKDRIYVFWGYSHWRFAKRYADKRTQMNGLMHHVMPTGRKSEQLIVFNSKERKAMQRKGLMSKKVTALDIMKSAYHTTKRK